MTTDVFKEEHDIISNVISELSKTNVAENFEKTNLDFNIAYMIFDVLESLQLVYWKLEQNQRLLKWAGFLRFAEKYQESLNGKH